MRQDQPAGAWPAQAEEFQRLLETALTMANELMMNSGLRSSVKPVSVNSVVTESTDMMSAIAGPKIRVKVTPAAKASQVYVRRVDLERMLLNIVFNATAAMPDGGVLAIETTSLVEQGGAPSDMNAPFGWLRLTIGDTGHGMSIHEIQRAKRVAPTPRPDGSGIGLSSVFTILNRLGGRMDIGSSRGSGTIVEILLPLAPPAGLLH
jgi:signal transduction histidine kinase